MAKSPKASGDETISWNTFKARFVEPSGRVVDNGNNGISHSEGQGYGMVLALQANDRKAFDAIWNWTKGNLRSPDTPLHAWRFDPKAAKPVADPNNATDGDILIAWALGEAGRKWGNKEHPKAAASLRQAILKDCTVEQSGLKLLLPGRNGFSHQGFVTLNPSYYVWPALDAFQAAAPEEGWSRINADGAALLARTRFGPDNLPVDWVDMATNGQVTPAAGRPPRFGFDAIRIPLYAALGQRKDMVQPIGQFWQKQIAQGGSIPAWIDVQTGERAPYPASPGLLAIASLFTTTAKPATLAADYYAAVLQMLVNSASN